MRHQAQDQEEVELKFELDDGAARKIRREPLLSKAEHRTEFQKTIYFETDEADIDRAGYLLRVRQNGKSFTQTVKSKAAAAGLFDRREWEAPVGRLELDQAALKRTPLRNPKKLGRRAKPILCSEVERTTWLVERDGGKVEVVLDAGTVSVVGKEAPLHELELELKDGDTEALFDFARHLGRKAPLQVGVLSKHDRGLMLAEGTLGRPYKGSRIVLDKAMDAGEALVLIVRECIRHFRLNEAPIIADHDPEALHQARVAIRRLRTSFVLFRPAIRKNCVDRLNKALKAFIVPFGVARNLDVFLASHGDSLGRRDRRNLRSARASAYDEVIEKLRSQSTRDLFLDLVEFTAADEWRRPAASAPVTEFAARRLDAVWDKIPTRKKVLRRLGDPQLHRLRINIKKLHYGVDFVTSLYAGKSLRKFLSSMKKMQDTLGEIHDEAVFLQIARDFGVADICGSDAGRRRRQLKRMEKCVRRLERRGRFWRG